MTANLHHNLPFDDYRALPGVGWSELRHMDASPAHYRAAAEGPEGEPSSQMLAGTLAHMATLEPERYERSVVVYEGRRQGKTWEAFREEHADTEHIVKPGEDARARAIADAVRSHPVAGPLLTGEAEVSVTWTHGTTDIDCRARLDWLDAERGILGELKTTSSTHPRKVAAQVARMGYHGQLAHYAEGARHALGATPTVYLVAVEQTPPHDVAVLWVHEDTLYAGAGWRRELLTRLAECRRADQWPGRSQQVKPLELPAWAFPDEADDTSNVLDEEA